MSDKRYEANIIRATAVEPANNLESTSAPGVWSIDEVVELQKKSKWPTVGNVVTNVDDVFSTYLWTGTNSANTIANGIDLTEGGLVWNKWRGITNNHTLVDTERGALKVISSNNTSAQVTNGANAPSSFLSNGFTYTDNGSGYDIASWTFRKQAKFFDVVTYTGNGVAGRTVAHNLGAVPGMIILKNLSSSGEGWRVYHRGANGGTNPEQYYAMLQATNAFAAASTPWNNTAPTSTEFTLGTDTGSNGNGNSFVAYLFAHNNNDGGFGPDQDEDIIKCGSFTSDSSSDASVTLGFEPQWLIIKRSDGTSNWTMMDNMRGWNNSYWNPLYADTTNAESGFAATRGFPTSTGFEFDGQLSASANYIYMAIRRPQAAPTAATQVFNIGTYGANRDNSSTSTYYAGFPVDMALKRNPVTSTASSLISTRMLETTDLSTNSSNAERTGETEEVFDSNTHWNNAAGTSTTSYSWMWKRARGYFDVCCYTGSGVAGRTVSHNLGVEPEMIWVKTRSNDVGWAVYNKTEGFSKGGRLELDGAYGTETNRVTGASSTTFTVGTDAYVNVSARTYVAYLFATLAGISKIGSVVHSGSSTDVDCGFTSGARLVILKRTDATGDWYLWDSVRGIVSGNDPYLLLNTTAAEVTNTDYIDPLSSGFQISGDFTDGTYIFYAIA